MVSGEPDDNEAEFSAVVSASEFRNDSVVGSSEVWGSGSGAGVDAIGEAVHAFGEAVDAIGEAAIGEATPFPGAEVSASFV